MAISHYKHFTFSYHARGFNRFLHLRFNTLSSTDKMRLEMYKSTLYSTIEQFYVLPYMLSTDHIIRQAVITPDDMTSSELNQRIAHFNTQLKTAAIFILDTQGKAIASSNWQDPGSYVGQNYSYRPIINTPCLA